MHWGGDDEPPCRHPPRKTLVVPNSHWSPSPNNEGPRRPIRLGVEVRRRRGDGGAEVGGEAEEQL